MIYLEAERVRHAYLRDLFADCNIKSIGFFGFSEVHCLAKGKTRIDIETASFSTTNSSIGLIDIATGKLEEFLMTLPLRKQEMLSNALRYLAKIDLASTDLASSNSDQASTIAQNSTR